MRKRTNMKGLVSHTNPNGRSYVSSKERCSIKLNKLEKLVAEGWKITHSEVKKEEPFKLFGTFTIEIPAEVLIKAGFRK